MATMGDSPRQDEVPTLDMSSEDWVKAVDGMDWKARPSGGWMKVDPCPNCGHPMMILCERAAYFIEDLPAGDDLSLARSMRYGLGRNKPPKVEITTTRKACDCEEGHDPWDSDSRGCGMKGLIKRPTGEQ